MGHCQAVWGVAHDGAESYPGLGAWFWRGQRTIRGSGAFLRRRRWVCDRIASEGDLNLIDDSVDTHIRSAALSLSSQIAIILIFVGVAGAAFMLAGKTPTIAARDPEIASTDKKGSLFFPTPSQWATMTIEPVRQRVFRSEHVTEGKIAIDEDRSTPIFSPYAGQVVKLFVQPGDTVSVGQPLFAVQATDMVQAQNDFISAARQGSPAKGGPKRACRARRRRERLPPGRGYARSRA